MPPKGSTKTKAAATPTKAATSAKAAVKETPKKDTPKKDIPKSAKKESEDGTPTKPKKPAAVYTAVEKVKGAANPVDVTFEGDLAEAKLLKNGNFTHKLKLEAAATFTILKTYTIQEGENEGQQVIVLQPAKALAFKKFPPEIRKRIYSFYLAPKGVVNNPIIIDAKRKGTPDVYSKSYADGSKNRVGLIAVDKEIHEEIVGMLYAMPIRFGTTTDLLDFIGLIKPEHKARLQNLEIKKYAKSSARIAFTFLADVHNIKRIKFETDVCTDDDPSRAARNFWADASKLLEAVGSRKEKEMVKVPVAKPKKAESDGEASEVGDSDGHDDLEALAAEETATPKAPKDLADDDMDTLDDMFKKPTPTEPEDNTPVKSIEPLDKASATKPNASNNKQATKPEFIERPGRKSDAVDILHFGAKALQFKDEDKDICIYDDEMKEEFIDALKAKLNTQHLSYWSCVCGSVVAPHSCSEELAAKGKKTLVSAVDEFEHFGHGGAGMLNLVFAH